MFDAGKLWGERLGTASKEIGRYSRYIFNGHIVLVLVFLLGTASFYYQQWIATLQPDFPVQWVMSILLGLLLTISPIFSFLEEPDKVFLLPLEEKLLTYFNRSIILSWLVGIYLLVIGLGVLMPIYAQVTGEGFSRFIPFLLVISFAKLWNLLCRWQILHHVETSTHQWDGVIRFILNTAFLYLVFNGASILFIVAMAIVMLLFFYASYQQAKSKGLKWETLIGLEERRMMSFYRLANMFTDVPQLKDEVKRRKWLDFISAQLPYHPNQTFLHLFVQTFLRGGDYLGLWVRLSVIGGLLLYFVTYGFGQIVFVMIILYLTGFQLLPLWNHHQNKLWIDLYPVNEAMKKRGFQTLMFQLLNLQGLVLSVPLFIKAEWLVAVATIAAGLCFSYMYVYIYIRKKLGVKSY